MVPVAVEENDLLNDGKYKLYVNSVDKALKSFEYTSEWADLISALGKLNKILLNHTKYPVIPRRLKISKRLAQCLHPALPSGVHLKALETYDIMFRTMGTNRLSQELFIYSSGLFPVLGHAATNVKPSLLSIYETHFVPLGERLGPGLNGFLSGVLPGLEEGSDYYDRTNTLLEKVCSGTNPSLFYTCLWECLVTNAAVRLPAIIFILSHFDRHLPMKNQIFLIGRDVDLMVNGLCTCFQDESVLIQRSALDFLLVGFPMHETNLSRHHCQVLLTSALVTLLRRDMSLNRRLFAWLLGSDVSSNSSQVDFGGKSSTRNESGETSEGMTIIDQYFEKYSKDLLISAIKCVLKNVTGENPHDLRPYRILISLLDKSDIGPIILDDILFEVFRLLYLCWQNPGNRAPNGAELLKAANLLFSSLEPRYLWQYVGVLFSEACHKIPSTSLTYLSSSRNDNGDDSDVKPVDSGDPSLVEVCNMIIFLLDTLSLEIYSETFSEYLPSLFLHVIVSLTDHCDGINASQMNASLRLCLKILTKIRSPIIASSLQINSSAGSYEDNINNNHCGSSFSSIENKMAEPGRVVQLTNSAVAQFSTANRNNSKSGCSSNNESTKVENSYTYTINDELKTTDAGRNESRLSCASELEVEGSSKMAFSSGCFGDNQYCMSTTIEDENTSVCKVEQHNTSVKSSEPQPVVYELSPMEKCLQSYKKFYVTLVYIVRLKLGDTKSISNLFESLIIKSADLIAEDRIKSLELLLLRVLRQYTDAISVNRRFLSLSCDCCTADSAESLSSSNKTLSSIYDTEAIQCNTDCLFASYYAKDSVGFQWEDPFSHACKLLVELSTFQTSVPSHDQYIGKENALRITEDSKSDLPDWLKSLIVCSCWLGSTCVPLQLVAISTLLDLSILCRRTEIYTQPCSSPTKNNVHSSSVTTSSAVSSNQIVTVVFVPLLTSNQLTFIECNTNVFQVIMYWLWLHLSNPQYEVKCAELICQLQNTLHNQDIVENCIGEALSVSQSDHDRLDSFRKFVKLWHISRGIIRNANYSRVEDTFYRCMLKILDSLPRNESDCLRLEAENWLFHSLLQGDCSRIMEPLLLILLDRRTARIGVSYAKIQQHLECDNTQVADLDRNSVIFVVCSIYGSTLTYHLLRSPSISLASSNSIPSTVTRASEQSDTLSTCLTSTVGLHGDSVVNSSHSSSTETMKTTPLFDLELNQASSAGDVSCQEYLKRLPYLQSISVFANHGSDVDASLSVDVLNETSLSVDEKKWCPGAASYIADGNNTSSIDLESGDEQKVVCSKYNTLPLIKGKMMTDTQHKFGGSYSSLKDVDTGTIMTINQSSRLDYLTSSSGSNEGSLHNVGSMDMLTTVIDSKATTTTTTTFTCTSTGTDLVRSLSFSAAEKGAVVSSKKSNSSVLNRYHSQHLSGDVDSDKSVAKAVIEDIISQIVDTVIMDGKKSDELPTMEKEEEVDSAISCNSGCSSVTLEYEKDSLGIDDEDNVDQGDGDVDENENNGNIHENDSIEQHHHLQDDGYKTNENNEDDEHVCKKIVEELEKKQMATRTTATVAEKSNSSNVLAVQFYSHMLLYCDLYDKSRTLYTLQKFRDIIRVSGKIFLFVASTAVVSPQAPMVSFLMKHRNSIFARGFQCNEKPSEAFHKNTTYLEVLITICLYYIRSYYPNFGSHRISLEDVLGNKQVQIAGIDLLTETFFQLGSILSSSENEMTFCIRELLNRCKVQKTVLHCMLCCLSNDSSQNLHIFVKEILIFNLANEEELNENELTAVEYSRAFQVQYLRLLLSLIVLENEIYRKEKNSINVVENDLDSDISGKYDYLNDRPIVHQPLFLNLLKKTLEPDERRRPIHERVFSFVIACLPYLKKSSAKIIATVIGQLCSNIETCANMYIFPELYRSSSVNKRRSTPPFNYAITLLDALTILSHYCLLEFNTQVFLKPFSDGTSLKTFKGLFQMYSDFPNSGNLCGTRMYTQCEEAKESVLDNLPKIFDAISSLWKAVTSSDKREYENVCGSLPNVKSEILNLLNPIAIHHSIHFFVSVAIVWKEKLSNTEKNSQKMSVIPEANEEQRVLIRLLCSMTAVNPDSLISSIYRIIKQRVIFDQERSAEIEISILEVLVHYIQFVTIPKLMECWTPLVPLFREASNVSTRSQFLLCAAISQFVNCLPSTPDRLMDKKDFKDMQEIIVKLVEICTQIAGAGLEQTTWLRRNLAVRDNVSSSSGVLTSSILFNKDSDKQSGAVAQHSPTAQIFLAQVLVPLLDIVFTNQDKEKCVNLLVNVMYNITPYLKNHTQRNAMNFYACSQLLASISSYQYARKAWKKDAMDLLLDSSLFQMEIRSLKHWRTIVDNLMSQDISTFRDLLGRVSINQNNTLNLFSSKEQEYELRSQLLKRLAFVLLCCEQDQFHKHMPDIQEKLVDSLKLPQGTPGIQAQVFLCFRVLLLKMSPHHMTSFWPVIITEMVQVMLQLEHDLTSDLETSSPMTRSLSSLDWSWSMNTGGSSNSVQSSCHPHWLQLQLAAAKLLKLAVQLPADRLPQFQMYRWAFVGKYRRSDMAHPTASSNTNNTEASSATETEQLTDFGGNFVPHVIRIASLMNNRFGKITRKQSSENLLPAACQIRTLQDLHPFYTTLTAGYIDETPNAATIATILENEIEFDFLEQLPFSSSSSSSSSSLSSSFLQSSNK